MLLIIGSQRMCYCYRKPEDDNVTKSQRMLMLQQDRGSWCYTKPKDVTVTGCQRMMLSQSYGDREPAMNSAPASSTYHRISNLL